MRSSKKRSRSSQNRPRTLGNIVNRVFDSSGPEGKVRGTPQQIIEKYQMLARDAQLSNDRVAAENFLQHAEHYTRMLAEAMREMALEQETRQQQYPQGGGQNGGQNVGQNGGQYGSQNGGQHGGQQGGQPGGQPRGDRQGEGRDRGERFDRGDRGGERSGDRGPERVPDRGPERAGERPDRPENRDRGERRQDYGRDFREERSFVTEEQPMASDVIELTEGDDTGLIETPESVARARIVPETVAAEAAAEAPVKEERSAARRPRAPRKPKAEGKPDGEPPQEAAE